MSSDISKMVSLAKDLNLEELGKVMRENGVVRLTVKMASGDELNFYCKESKSDWLNAIKNPKATRLKHIKNEPLFLTTLDFTK